MNKFRHEYFLFCANSNLQDVKQIWIFMQVLDAFLEQLSDQTTLDSLTTSGGCDMTANKLTTTLGLEHTLRTHEL